MAKLSISFPEELRDEVKNASGNVSRFLTLAASYALEHDEVLAGILGRIEMEKKTANAMTDPVRKKERAAKKSGRDVVETKDPTVEDGGAVNEPASSNSPPSSLSEKPMTSKEIVESFQGSKIVGNLMNKNKGVPVTTGAATATSIAMLPSTCNHLDHDIELVPSAVLCSNCSATLHKHKRYATGNGGVWHCVCGARSLNNGQKWTAPEEEVW